MKYKVVNGSKSGHCCFEATVISVEADGTEDTICECFSSVTAEMICEALNKTEDIKNHDY
jgi:uncharacterized protein (DUF433 family)